MLGRPLSAPRPEGRWFSTGGNARPLLALALPGAPALERIADPERVRTRWCAVMDRARDLGIPFVGIPDGLWHEAADLRLLCRESSSRGLGALCPLELRDLPRPGADRLLTELASSQPALLPTLDLGVMAHLDDLDPLVEDELPLLLHDRGLALVTLLRDPCGQGGLLLRRAAFSVDGIGVLAPEPEARELAHLHAACLAARPLDRPSMLAVTVPDPDRLAEVLGLGLASGMAMILLDPGPPDSADARAIDEVLSGFVAWLDSLPAAMPAPEAEDHASLLFDRGAMPAADDVLVRRAIAEASLGFVREFAGAPARFLFEVAARQERTPRFVHLPAHGALDESTWSRLWKLGSDGAHVLVTGLCLEGQATTRRLAELAIPERSVEADRLGAFPHWLRRRPLLDTQAVAMTVPRGRGTLTFLDLCPELSEAGAERPELDPLRELLGFPLAPHAGYGWHCSLGSVEWRSGDPLPRWLPHGS